MESSDFQLWKIEFVWQMREFKLDLFRHFEFEDESLLFDHFPVSLAKPGLFGLTIRREHTKMLLDLDKVFNRLKKIKHAEDPRLKKLVADIRQLIAVIEEHESKEQKILATLAKKQG
jgi:hypothetical protein